MDIDDNKKQVIEKIDALPTLPAIIIKILECIEDPHSSAENLKNIIANDPPTSTKILSLANSAYYGYTRTVEDIKRAVVILGFETVIDVAMNVSLNSILHTPANFLSVFMGKLWAHSISAGETCRLCAKENLYPHKEKAFLIGLTHDIGTIALACFFPDEFSRAIKNAKNENKFIYDIEKNIFGFSHYELGALLADKWNLPPAISAPIQFHHELEKAPEEYQKEVIMTHFADYLVKFAGIGDSGDNNKLPELSPLVDSVLGIDEEKIKSLAQKLEDLKPKIDAFMTSIL